MGVAFVIHAQQVMGALFRAHKRDVRQWRHRISARQFGECVQFAFKRSARKIWQRRKHLAFEMGAKLIRGVFKECARSAVRQKLSIIRIHPTPFPKRKV
ncbi:hypothetical protein [Methylocystis suflitae]|uniref:hypothetical protein n=1 Tax=Methylocystis suflitae TaxID=2951405 RepID=UPI00210E151C|nr:hypothetical protein [Methylocystis suflitae]MCQ4188220.1 hypothetical protein [Methylocystis suflitae]